MRLGLWARSLNTVKVVTDMSSQGAEWDLALRSWTHWVLTARCQWPNIRRRRFISSTILLHHLGCEHALCLLSTTYSLPLVLPPPSETRRGIESNICIIIVAQKLVGVLIVRGNV